MSFHDMEHELLEARERVAELEADLKWSADQRRLALRSKEAAEAEVALLREALFECYALSGEDTDGATGAADMGWTTPGIDVLAVRGVRQLRVDYDEALAGGGQCGAVLNEEPDARCELPKGHSTHHGYPEGLDRL